MTDRPRILITDPIDEEGLRLMKEVGEVVYKPKIPREELLNEVRNADILVVRSGTKVTSDVIEAAPRLRMICRAGVGVDNIDVDAATRRGIFVVNAPEASSISVAEHTFALMLAVARKIVQADRSVREGRWERKKFLGFELYGKTLGIIGLGRIGSQVAIRAKSFGMRVLAYDPYVSEDYAKRLGVELVDLETLLRESDIVTIHVPLTKDTYRMIDREKISMMKDGAILVNCARGGIVDEEALYEALKNGKLAGAALDVFEKEPPVGSPLLELDNIVLTPHLGASTVEAQRSAARIIAEEIMRFVRGEPLRNVVNIPVLDPYAFEKLRPYMDLAKVMGILASSLSKGRIKEIRITYRGELSRIPQVEVLGRFVLSGLLSPILNEAINIVNAPIVARSRGISIVDGKSEETDLYQSLLSVEVRDDGRTIAKITGTILPPSLMRIVEINDYKIDFTPGEHMLLVFHEDKPGMIGKIASTLGKHKINIGGMQVGRRKPGETQLMVAILDSEVPKNVLEEIKGIKGVVDAISLDM